MSRMRDVQSKKRGAALALALFAVVILLVTGMGLLRLGLQARVYAARVSDEIAARAAADAGLERALFEMNQKLQLTSVGDDPSFSRLENVPLANCNATYSYKIVANSIQQNMKKDYTVTCTGSSGRSQKTVYATVSVKGLFESAILSRGRIDLMPNTLVTGYNSADPTDKDIDVKIGTTSTVDEFISLGPGTVVDGDVFVGVGGNPEKVIEWAGTINGEKYALMEEIEFPVITPPSQLRDFGTAIDAKGETVTLRPADNGSYKEITLSASSGTPGVLEIDGGKVVLHLTGDIDLGNDCEIVVRANSTLILYTNGNIGMGNSAGFVNENGSSAMLKIFATGQDLQTFELKTKSEVFGVVYAPNADIELYPKAALYGAIVANNVLIKSGGTFYYDEALRNVSPDDEGASFVIEKWWE